MTDQDKYRTRYSLIKRVQDGSDEKSWEEFILTYKPFIIFLLSRYSLSHDSIEEFCQRIIVKCWEKVPDFQIREGHGKFRAWLKVMIRNEFLNQKRRDATEERKIEEIKKDLNQSEDDFEEEWNYYISQKAWENLSPKLKEQHRLIYTYALEGLSVDEISQKLEIPSNTVYTSRRRTTEKLKTEFSRLLSTYEYQNKS